jgi:ribosomal protein S18 acetylase RimI-like enzyme
VSSASRLSDTFPGVSVTLRPMTATEYEAWLPRSRAAYAADMAANAGIDEKTAAAKARDDFATLLPDGVDTPTHSVYVVDRDGSPAGSLWLAERDAQTGRELFVYELWIDPDHRRNGVGRAAMEFAEEEARRRGLTRVTLNVFGGNDAARGLYRSLGYREAAVWMAKDV